MTAGECSAKPPFGTMMGVSVSISGNPTPVSPLELMGDQ